MTGSMFRYYALAIAAAGIFGASFPLSKLLLRDIAPIGLAGLLYLGSGLGVGALRLLIRGHATHEASLKKSDLGWLASVILSGGVVGPILLLLGLAPTSAHVSALLANAETLFTMALAVAFIDDFLVRRAVLGAAAIFVGATLVAWGGAPATGALSHGIALCFSLVPGLLGGWTITSLKRSRLPLLPQKGLRFSWWPGSVGTF